MRSSSSAGQLFKGRDLLRPQFLQIRRSFAHQNNDWKHELSVSAHIFWRISSERCSVEEKKVAHHVGESWQTPWDAGNEQRETAKLPRSFSPAKCAKESQAWLNVLEKELPPCFWPTWWETCQPISRRLTRVLEHELTTWMERAGFQLEWCFVQCIPADDLG